jgi:hypothetical protein
VGDGRRLRMMDRWNKCLHESAHSVARQLLLGDLGETGIVRKGFSFSHPIERKRLVEMSRERLAKTAVVVAAGIVAENELCSDVGMKDRAVAEDVRQWEAIQRIGGFSDEEMSTFWDEATEIVRAHEGVIRRVAIELDRKNKLTGEQVSRLIESAGTTRQRTSARQGGEWTR